MKLTHDSPLGKEIVEAYIYVTQQEEKHYSFPRPEAERILNKVRHIAEQHPNSQLHRELKNLEDKFALHGTFKSIETNLGIRTILHVLIEMNNLFNIQRGWVLGNDGQQHFIVDSKTKCGLTIVSDSQPYNSFNEHWDICSVCRKPEG